MQNLPWPSPSSQPQNFTRGPGHSLSFCSSELPKPSTLPPPLPDPRCLRTPQKGL